MTSRNARKISDSLNLYFNPEETENKDKYINLFTKSFAKNSNSNSHIKQKKKKANDSIKLFCPPKGMSVLKRTVELQREEPYFFLNRLYGRNEAIDQQPLLRNLFNRNKIQFESKMKMNIPN